MSKNKHLDRNDRTIILRGIVERSPRTAIATTLGKDSSTIAKEIRLHRLTVPPKKFQIAKNLGGPIVRCAIKDCIHIENGTCPLHRKTQNGKCFDPCDHPQPFPCRQRDRWLACNGCSDQKKCFRFQYKYDPDSAQEEYSSLLRESRAGINMTTGQLDQLAAIIAPLLQRGLSVESILSAHPQIEVCAKTIYNLINDGYLKPYGIDRFSTRRSVNRRQSSVKKNYKPRVDRSYQIGRTYKDFCEYVRAHPQVHVWEMDTVYNDIHTGPFIQTFLERSSNFMIAHLCTEKTADQMLEGIIRIHDQLSEEEFKKYFQVILTDRGSEFTKADEIEKLGCRIFYCDPMQSGQKGKIEENHTMLRYICPKKADLAELGLRGQEDLDTICSHLNSYPRKSLSGRTPYDAFQFFLRNDELPTKLHICRIAFDDLNLRPDLIRKD